MRLLNRRTRSYGGGRQEPYKSLVTNRWRMHESGLTLPPVLVDSVGGNDITPTLGQGLDFDGGDDTAKVDSALGDLTDLATTSLTFAGIFKAGGSFTGARCQVYGGGHATLGPFLAVQSTMLPQVYFYYTHTVSTKIQAIASSTTLTLTANVPYMLMATITPTVGSTSVTVNFTRVNLATGAVTTESVPVTLAGNFVYFSKIGSAVNDSLCFMCGNTLYMTGVGFSAAVGISAPDYADVLAILSNPASTAAAIEAVMGAKSYCHYADGGSGSTIAEATGNNFGTVPTLTIGADYATMWANGSHESGFPQKGFGGGAYTGGVGVRVLHTFNVTGDADPGSGISLSEFNTLGSNFTFDGWVYKPNASAPLTETIFSTLDAFVTRRGVNLRVPTAVATSLQLDVFGATTTSTATVAMNASGWWYFGVVYRAGVAELYLAQPADSSFASNVSATNGGSATVVPTAGVNNLYIMARYDSAPGTNSNCEAGTGIDALAHIAGTALTEAQLLERFNYSKARYL